MTPLSDIILTVQESATFKVKSKALKLKAEGRRVFDLSTGEPEFKMPPHISAAITDALAAGYTRYTAVAGIPELRAALAVEIEEKTALKFDPGAEIIVTNGGKQGLFASCACLLNPGDEALVPMPYWVSYPQMVKLAGARPIYLEPGPNLKITPASLRHAINHRTKLLILNSPSNPSGAVYSEEELRQLGEVLKGTDVFVLWDAVYDEVFFNGKVAPDWLKVNPELRHQSVYINSFSKTFAMTGLRVGYLAAEAEIAAAVLKHQNQSTSNICAPAQYGALAALRNPRQFISEWSNSYSQRASLACEQLEKIPGVQIPCRPEGAFYILVDVWQIIKNNPKFASAEDFAADLIDKTGIALVPGDAFGAPSMVRFSLTLELKQLEEVLSAFSSYCRAI